MNLGKTLFAQLMEFVPWTSFARIVARYGGDSRVRSLACTEQFRAMAFAQLTYRESLRDIETCLRANQTKLYGRASARQSGVRRWPMPTRDATGASGRTWPPCSSDGRANCTATTASVSTWTTRFTPWMPRPSTCACRCSRGPRSVLPRRQSSCIRCSTCAATSRPSSISRTARPTRSTCWIC